MPCSNSNLRSGFTIVELLVSIAVIGILVALLLPAVQSAREASRRTQCRNNLKQISLAFHQHADVHREFPSNGWGYLWVGDPDAGVGKSQPGCWIYQLLPQLEQRNLADLGRGESVLAKRASLARLSESVVPVFDCPTRPEDTHATQYAHSFRNADFRQSVFKTDYAVNEGDFFQDSGEGPPSMSSTDLAAYPWIDRTLVTGVSYQRGAARFADITDGTSQTYLVGEKFVRRTAYNVGGDPGHDQNAYSGCDLDNKRWVISPPLRDSAESGERDFGSAHDSGCNMALCDGSVRFISYNVDQEVHRRLGNRQDGLGVEVP